MNVIQKNRPSLFSHKTGRFSNGLDDVCLSQEIMLQWNYRKEILKNDSSCFRHKWNSIHLWIIFFPAFMNGKCTFALISTGWILAFLEKGISNMTDFVIQLVNMCLNLFEMNFTIVIDNSANQTSRINSKDSPQNKTKQFQFLTWIHGKGSSCSILMLHLHEPDHHWIPWLRLKTIHNYSILIKLTWNY